MIHAYLPAGRHARARSRGRPHHAAPKSSQHRRREARIRLPGVGLLEGLQQGFDVDVHVLQRRRTLLPLPPAVAGLHLALGLLTVLIYKVYVDGTTTMPTHERKACISENYEAGRAEIDEDCEICVELNNNVVLPNCSHTMC